MDRLRLFIGCNSNGSVTPWSANEVVVAGVLRRQLTTPAVGSERVFVSLNGGACGASEPTFVLTQGAKTVDNAVTWMECTGKAGVNGFLASTSNWNDVQGLNISQGVLLQRIGGGSLQICTTAGICGSGLEPAFSNTAGTTTTDGAATWT
jgi:hypothetical protein